MNRQIVTGTRSRTREKITRSEKNCCSLVVEYRSGMQGCRSNHGCPWARSCCHSGCVSLTYPSALYHGRGGNHNPTIDQRRCLHGASNHGKVAAELSDSALMATLTSVLEIFCVFYFTIFHLTDVHNFPPHCRLAGSMGAVSIHVSQCSIRGPSSCNSPRQQLLRCLSFFQRTRRQQRRLISLGLFVIPKSALPHSPPVTASE